MTQEEQILRSRSLAAAWKKRPDYVGDLIKSDPRIYNSWRAIRFTKKGKAAGCCDEWHNFRTFYSHIKPHYFDGCVLLRKDKMRPWGPDNFICVTSEEAGAIRERVFIEYDGKRMTLREWADYYGISHNGLRIRYYRHRKEYTPEQLLFGIRHNRGSKSAKDISDKGVNPRAKASKMLSSYRIIDQKNGYELCDMSIDWMLENIISKPCHYCGDTRRIGCDRIDNTKGHTKDNVVPCCIECNSARNNYFTYDEMRRLGKTIAEIKKARKV